MTGAIANKDFLLDLPITNFNVNKTLASVKLHCKKYANLRHFFWSIISLTWTEYRNLQRKILDLLHKHE